MCNYDCRPTFLCLHCVHSHVVVAFSVRICKQSRRECRGFVKTISPLYIGFVTTFFVLAAYLVMLHLLWTAIVDLHVKRTMHMHRAICSGLTNCHRCEQFSDYSATLAFLSFSLAECSIIVIVINVSNFSAGTVLP